MSPVDTSVLARKVAWMESRLALLLPVAAFTLDQYRTDELRKKGAEKALQELINAAIDANFHVLVQSGRPAPSDAFRSFSDLVGLGLIDDARAKVLAPYAGLRNRLVHEYETLDDSKVLAAIQEAQQEFPPYIRALRARFLPSAP